MTTRRNFLQKIAAASIIVPFTTTSAPAAAQQNTMDHNLRVAILGFGSYGTRVADAMQSCTKAKLVGAISGTPGKLTHVAKQV